MTQQRRIMTLQRAHQETGASVTTLRRLVDEGRLTKYRITSKLVGISITEFEKLAEEQIHKPVAPVNKKLRARAA